MLKNRCHHGRLRQTVPIVGIGLTVLLTACISPRFPVRTLPKNEAVITASLGVHSGIRLDITGHGSQPSMYPVMSTGFAYGLYDGVTLHTNLHPAVLAFGTLAGDIGASARICHENGFLPELTATGKVNGAVHFLNNNAGAGFGALEPSLIASYSTDTNNIFYFGTSHQFTNYDGPGPLYWRPSAYVGIGKKNYNSTRPLYQIDAGLITRDSERKIVDGFIMMTVQFRL